MTVAFELDGETIGTIRAVPLGNGLTLVEKLFHELAPQPEEMLDRSWEMGRLVLAPHVRGDAESLRHCLHLALDYLNQVATARNLHAACTPILARLYRRFGFGVVAQDVPLRDTPKTYSLIHGPFQRVLAALSGTDEIPALRVHTGLPYAVNDAVALEVRQCA